MPIDVTQQRTSSVFSDIYEGGVYISGLASDDEEAQIVKMLESDPALTTETAEARLSHTLSDHIAYFADPANPNTHKITKGTSYGCLDSINACFKGMLKCLGLSSGKRKKI